MRGADLPIGVFDSGIGGLTVVRELLRRLPDETIAYFGDTARVPYGPKAPETIRRYSREAADLLVTHGIKALVVACNTATAHAVDALADSLAVPVIGVVEPGVRAAAAATRSKRVGVLGTVGTIGSGVYDRGLRRLVPDVQVFAQACPLFVPLAEEGFGDHEAARLIAEEYLAPLREMDVDVVILGCTHYPILHGLIAEAMGPQVTLIDSGAETAGEIERVLTDGGLRGGASAGAEHTFLVSDSPGRFREVGSRFMGRPLGRVLLHELEHEPARS
jgi:glutamate racemase